MEIQTLNDTLEKIGSTVVENQTATKQQLDDMAKKYDNLDQSITELAQKGHRPLMAHGTPEPKSLGDMFVKEFEANREIFEKGRSLRLELKAASDPVTTASSRSIVDIGVGGVGYSELGLQYALERFKSASSTAVEYSRYIGDQGAAAQQVGEGDLKANVRPDHTIIQQSAITIAGISKISRQAVSDSPQLRRVVDVTLGRSIMTQLDAILVNGATGFTGGFAGLATAVTSPSYSELVDAISECVANMQTDGFNPTVVSMTPLDWLAITTAKGTSNDHYLSGSYLGEMPSTLRGLEVVLSPTVPAGKALVMDKGHADLMIVNDYTVEMAYSGDDFSRNLATILGEMRVIPVYRTTGAFRLVTPAV